jgi:hypothetical protein
MSYACGDPRSNLPIGRLQIAALIALISMISYVSTRSKNKLTGEVRVVLRRRARFGHRDLHGRADEPASLGK